MLRITRLSILTDILRLSRRRKRSKGVPTSRNTVAMFSISCGRSNSMRPNFQVGSECSGYPRAARPAKLKCALPERALRWQDYRAWIKRLGDSGCSIACPVDKGRGCAGAKSSIAVASETPPSALAVYDLTSVTLTAGTVTCNEVYESDSESA